MPGLAQLEPTDRYKVWEVATMGKANDKQARSRIVGLAMCAKAD